MALTADAKGVVVRLHQTQGVCNPSTAIPPFRVRVRVIVVRIRVVVIRVRVRVVVVRVRVKVVVVGVRVMHLSLFAVE